MDKTILEALRWRYATKIYDTSRKVSDADLDTLLEVMRLSPSCYGIQPWKFIVVRDSRVREQLKVAAYGQAQVSDASHLIVLCRRTDLDAAYVDHLIESTAMTRHQTISDLAGLRGAFMSQISMDAADLVQWASRQVYIPLGMLVEAAALMCIDASPMEGFSPEKFDEILGLSAQHLASVVICGLGYRSPEDTYAAAAKVRLPKAEVVNG